MSTNSTKRYISFLEDERNSSMVYHAIAEFEKNPQIAEVYRRLGNTEDGHAKIWAEKISAEGGAVPEFKPRIRSYLLIWIARRFGPSAVLPSLISAEQTGVSGYSGQAETRSMQATELAHGRILQAVQQSAEGGVQGATLAQLEGRHRSAGGNALRAAVLGANDGLVSNFSLVMGVAGAAMNNTLVLVTGIAGLLAGSISMALGEWISVTSSRELYTHQIEIETEEIEAAPEEEREELALIYQARGLDEATAEVLSKKVMADSATAVQTMVRDELGIDPTELGGSAWEAAITSWLLFSAGALLPILPFIFLRGMNAVMLSIAFSAIGLFVIGAAITLFTGRNLLQSGFRQVLFGLAAAAVTYSIGRILGVSIGG